MKKKIVYVLLLVSLTKGLYGQQYKAILDFGSELKPSNLTNIFYDNIDIQINFTDGSYIVIVSESLLKKSLGPIHTFYFGVNKVPKTIQGHRSMSFINGNYNKYFTPSGIQAISYCDNYFRYGGIFPGTAYLKIYPEVSLSPSGTGHLIGRDDKFHLSATPGFPVDVYKWQYNIGNDWRTIPNSYGHAQIAFTGYELLGNEFDNLYGNQNIHFRLAPCPGFATPITTATPKLSSPNIISVKPLPNTCFDNQDGGLRVQFDRPLKGGEKLNLSLEGPIWYSKQNVEIFERDNTITWNNLIPGEYKLKIIGSYNNTITHSDGIAHKADSIYIPNTPPLTFSTSHKNVNCFDGNDASITINALGGIKDYTVGYKKQNDNDYQYQSFKAATLHTINGLSAGMYQVRLYDGNKCVMRDQKGQEVIKTIEIKQPLKAISIDHKEGKNPSAFRYTDGWIRATITGGTPGDDNSYHIIWKNSEGAVLTTVNNNANPFATQLFGIGKGDYYLTVTDKNYSYIAPNTTTLGCIVQEKITLDEPAELKVIIEKNQSINCKGMANGQLFAKASGGIKIPDIDYHYQWFHKEKNIWTAISQNGSVANNLQSAIYKVKITDHNDITKESEPFHLTEPEELKVILSSSPAKCSGSHTGVISATVTGGTPPYTLEWSTGATNTTTLEHILAGEYYLFVTDAYKCQTEATVSVATPKPLEVKELVVQEPTCSGGSDGSIRFTCIGGVPPYTYQLIHLNPNSGTTTTERDIVPNIIAHIGHLYAGHYQVIITDTQGCILIKDYQLFDPPPVKIDLGPDRTLCTNQVWIADATIDDRFAQYQWTGPNRFTSKTSRVTLKNEGNYSVIITTRKGCQGTGSLTISRHHATIEAEYTTATQAFINEPIIFINVNKIETDNTEWILPETSSIKVVNKNKNLAELVFTKEGSYEVTLRSTLAACEKMFKKVITILSKDEVQHYPTGKTTLPFIREFKIGPNPNQGEFTVDVILEQIVPINLRLIEVQTGKIIDHKQQNSSNHYTLPYNLTLHRGVYILVLEAAKENRIFRIMVL